MLASDMHLTIPIGSAMPMLLHLLALCGNGDTCTVKLPDIRAATGASHSTLKSWLNRLAEAGMIEKNAIGPLGVTIKIVHPRLLDQCHEGSALAHAAKVLRNLAQTVFIMLDHTAESLEKLGKEQM